MNAAIGQANSVGYGNQTPAVPQMPIPSAVGELGQAINDTGILIDSLVGRLATVLSPSYPQVESKGISGSAQLTAAPPPTSVMVDEMRGYRQRLESFQERLRDALSRLEV